MSGLFFGGGFGRLRRLLQIAAAVYQVLDNIRRLVPGQLCGLRLVFLIQPAENNAFTVVVHKKQRFFPAEAARSIFVFQERGKGGRGGVAGRHIVYPPLAPGNMGPLQQYGLRQQFLSAPFRLWGCSGEVNVHVLAILNGDGPDRLISLLTDIGKPLGEKGVDVPLALGVCHPAVTVHDLLIDGKPAVLLEGYRLQGLFFPVHPYHNFGVAHQVAILDKGVHDGNAVPIDPLHGQGHQALRFQSEIAVFAADDLGEQLFKLAVIAVRRIVGQLWLPLADPLNGGNRLYRIGVGLFKDVLQQPALEALVSGVMAVQLRFL